MEVKDGFALKIMIPDNSGNYIHSEPKFLRETIVIRDRLIEFGKIEAIHTDIVKDDTYFRIKVGMVMYERYSTQSDEKKKVDYHILFHGRKLNIIDAVHEYDLITEQVLVKRKEFSPQ